MNTQQATMKYLEEIESNLDKRIELFMQLNQKYQNYLIFLNTIGTTNSTTSGVSSSEEKGDFKPSKDEYNEDRIKNHQQKTHVVETSPTITSAKDEDDEEKLNKILEKAKIIRESNQKKKIIPKDNSVKNTRVRSVSAPRGGRGGDGSGGLTPQKKINDMSSKNIDKSMRLNPITNSDSKKDDQKLLLKNDLNKKNHKTENKSNLHFLVTQAQILSNINSHCPLLAIFPTKSLILTQHRYLTSLFGYFKFPPSLLYEIISKTMNDIHHKDYSIDVYLNCLRNIRQEFEKSTQNKLNRVHPTSLTEHEISNIFIWWYLLRRCIEKHEQIYLQKSSSLVSSDSNNNSIITISEPLSENQRLCNLVTDMVYKYPLLSSNSSSTPHYQPYEFQVRYTVETIMSRLLLKDVLQELKECCAEEIANSRGDRPQSSARNRKTVPSRWKHALKGLQAVETCLLNGAERTGPTIFFLKDK